MPADQVRQIIEAELGAPIDLLFEWLELDEPLGSASIAQVGRIGRVQPAAAGGSSRLLGQRAVLAVGVRTLRVGAASHASKFSQVHLSVASGQLLLLPLPLLLLLLLLPLLLLLDHPASQPVARAVGPSAAQPAFWPLCRCTRGSFAAQWRGSSGSPLSSCRFGTSFAAGTPGCPLSPPAAGRRSTCWRPASMGPATGWWQSRWGWGRCELRVGRGSGGGLWQGCLEAGSVRAGSSQLALHT